MKRAFAARANANYATRLSPITNSPPVKLRVITPFLGLLPTEVDQMPVASESLNFKFNGPEREFQRKLIYYEGIVSVLSFTLIKLYCRKVCCWY